MSQTNPRAGRQPFKPPRAKVTHSTPNRPRVNDADSSHDPLGNSVSDQLNRRKRRLSDSDCDESDEENPISPSSKFNRQVIY